MAHNKKAKNEKKKQKKNEKRNEIEIVNIQNHFITDYCLILTLLIVIIDIHIYSI